MRGITTINIGGEIRTLSLKNNFLVLLGVQLGCDPLSIPKKVADLGETNPFQIVTLIVYCGLIANMDREANFAHYYTTKPIEQPDKSIKYVGVPLTLQVVAAWMDDANDEEMQSVWSEFAEIMGFPRASEEKIAEYETALKKKITDTETPEQVEVTFRQLFEDAVIHLNLSPSEFYDLTLYEYRCIICRHKFNHARDWEHTRRIVHAVFRSQSTKDFPVIDIMPLLTDPKQKEPQKQTPEEKERLRQVSEERLRLIAEMKNKV